MDESLDNLKASLGTFQQELSAYQANKNDVNFKKSRSYSNSSYNALSDPDYVKLDGAQLELHKRLGPLERYIQIFGGNPLCYRQALSNDATPNNMKDALQDLSQVLGRLEAMSKTEYKKHLKQINRVDYWMVPKPLLWKKWIYKHWKGISGVITIVGTLAAGVTEGWHFVQWLYLHI